MKHYLSKSGNLIFETDLLGQLHLQADKQENEDFLSEQFMYDLLEPIICNLELEWIRPEEIGALTDAPILGIVDRNDNGELTKAESI
jgi:hypothetical protein